MKEKIYNITRYVVFGAALLQLALSQIHIGIITKVFATDVGFYLFMFIIFGVVVAFNVISMKPEKNMIIDFLGTTLASIGGVKYLGIVFADLKAENLLTFEEARLSIYLSIACIAIYIVGTLLLFIVKEREDVRSIT